MPDRERVNCGWSGRLIASVQDPRRFFDAVGQSLGFAGGIGALVFTLGGVGLATACIIRAKAIRPGGGGAWS